MNQRDRADSASRASQTRAGGTRANTRQGGRSTATGQSSEPSYAPEDREMSEGNSPRRRSRGERPYRSRAGDGPASRGSERSDASSELDQTASEGSFAVAHEHDAVHQDEPDGVQRTASRRSSRASSRKAIKASSFAPKRLPRGRAIQVGMPRTLQQSKLLRDQLSVILLGASIFSLLLLWITVANRIGALSDPMVLRYGAEGLPARTGAPRALLQLPLLATFATVMNIVVAWSVASADRFVGRFILGAALLIQTLIWIAVIALV